MSPALDPVRRSLEGLAVAWWRVRWLRVVARTTAVVTGVLLAWALVDRLRPLGRWPLLASGALVACIVAAAAWWMRRRALAHPAAERMARLVEEQCPELEATLRTALDPAVERSPLGAIVQADAADALARLDEARIIDPDDRRRAMLWAGAAVASVLVAAGLAAPTAVRAARTARFVVAPPSLTLRVTPGAQRLVKGTPLTITAAVEGAPRDLDVAAPTLQVEGEGVRAAGALTRRPDGVYEVRIPSVDRDFSYRVVAGGLRSDRYRVEALDRPRVEGIDLSYVYPSFSGLKPRTETDTGDIYAPAGTTVTVRVRTSKALRAAELRATDGEGARALPLSLVGDKAGEVAFTVARDGAYRIALTDIDAIANGDETEYFVRVMDDRPPDVRIIRPAGDRGATRLEEVRLEARAEDDYGVQALELVYAVRGGPEKVVPLGGGGATAVSGAHTIYLEDLDVKPGDFVSYYARARDIGRGKRSTEARSDIFFLEVKPTAQEFTAAQSSAMAGGGGGGGEMDDLVAAQKDVVSATWKLERRAAGGRSATDIKAVGRAQAEVREKLRQQAAGAGGAPSPSPRRRRGVDPAEAEAPPVPLQAAGEAMDRAVAQLDKLDTRSAITHEMTALNELLKAEAEIRRRQLARQQGGQGSGRMRTGNEDLSALFDQELMRQQTNYQQQSSVESRQEATKGQSALDRIRELARRQDDLAREQQQLARERSQLTAEEAKRRLERLTREQQRLQQEAQQLAQQMQNGQQSQQSQQSAQAGQQGSEQQQNGQQQASQQGQQSGQSRGQQGQQGQQASSGGGQSQGASNASRDRLREAAQQMGEATSQLQQQSPEQAAARGSRSAQALRDAERALQAGTPGERQRAAGDVQLEARQLAEAQRQLAQQAGELGQPQSGASANERRRQLAGEQGRLADRVASLERQVRELARGADPARDPLGQASRELQRSKAAEQLQQAARQLREGGTPQGTDLARQQRDAARVLDRVSALAGQASGRGTGETQALSERLSDARDLRDRLRSLEDRIAQLAQQAEREANGAPTQGGQQERADGQQGQRGSSSAAQQGPRGDQQASQAGSRGSAQGQGRGQAGDTLEQLRQLQQEYARELQDAARMVQGRDGGQDRGGRMATPEGHEFSRSAPGTEAFKQDFARWESLRKGVANAMDRYEASIAQRLAEREAAERVQAPLRDKVPDRYAESVVRYYQSLSRRPESR
ncbi:hypothetical protein TBR22_A21220 [Luteitalea sp. TBR-22]|uniref:DUF4175 family protein n=1 Tax=Luteitalea sp. TBR-22 TaxID=2802971 RepID=UPI001AF04FDE|nr:DUF4175 family protein [Luteitalea sp. TBR-22]BCS32898.1 hypothetical protein TBR22_A21220 [Luteitalea sp. TBR-22]